MTSRFPSLRARLLALLASFAIAPLHAQTPPAYPAIADADPVDALSRYLRMLAANPRDLASLTGAGRAALAVGDANAALGFYARAEEIAPRNGRIKAGLASALVQMEQPRTALKLFDEAVTLGVPVGDIASDRGLANDLNGDARRAQADYTVALRAKDDDETVRRLALSMAISGDRAGALTMLDPLLRKRDSGAIRARAFVLALTGDQAGAASVVRGAMPGAQAAVMANFMARLVKLNPAQKALAVNFGYFPSDGRSYSAAELFADARSGPLPATAPALAARDPRTDRRGDTPLIPRGEPLGPRATFAVNDADARAPRRRPGQIEAATEILPPAHVLAAPIPGQPRPAAPIATRTLPAAQLAALEPKALPATGRPSSTATIAPAPARAVPPPAVNTPPPGAATPAASIWRPSLTAPVAAQAPSPAPAPAVASAPVAPAVVLPVQTQRVDVPAAAPVPASAPGVTPAGSLIVTALGPALASSEPAPAAALAPPTIATVDLPASHSATAEALPVATPPASAPPPPTARPATRLAMLDRIPNADEAKKTVADKPIAKGRKAETRTEPAKEDGDAGRAGGKSKSAKADSTDADARSGKPDAKTPRSIKDKASATRLAAEEKAGKAGSAKDVKGKDKTGKDKTGKAKPEEAKSNGAKSNGAKPSDKDNPDTKAAAKSKVPERYWVQVASGSNKSNLDKAWSNVKGKAPKLLDGKTTYTAPWRASNRLLIGPFRTEDEAQAQVNKLAKAGVSGIQFTTRAGNDVEKVAAK